MRFDPMQLDETTLARTERIRVQDVDAREPRVAGPVLAAAAVVILAVGGVLWYRYAPRAQPAPPAAGAERAQSTAQRATALGPPVESVPPLAESDAFTRELIVSLAAHPELARWAATDDLVRRFVASVINVAEGTTPIKHAKVMAPASSFRAHEVNGEWFAEPASYARYDLATDVLESLDAAKAALLYERLHPLFDLAYAELGDPRSSFDATFARAIGNLLAVPISETPPELVPKESNFAYAEPALEGRSAAQRQLLRMGPRNAQRVQAKLRELAPALGLPPA